MSDSNKIWAVNYEGGKIIEHALMSPFCEGYSNIQIAMDAPFLGRIADTPLRRSATGMRAETAFADYDEVDMVANLTTALVAIREAAHMSKKFSVHELYIFQIARGQAASSTEHDILIPILRHLSIPEYATTHGYRSNTYFEPPSRPFVFVNIGMMACLNRALPPGQLCIPETTHDVTITAEDMIVTKSRGHQDDLLSTADFTGIHLFGIADNMPFVTPENYPGGGESFKSLADTVLNK